MLKKLQQIITALAAKSDNHSLGEKVRKVGAISAKNLRSSNALSKLANMGRIANIHEAETSSWVTYEDACAGQTGPFDACDLQHWLRIADLAGVDAVEAKEILKLTESEVSVASGQINLEASPTMRAAHKGARKVAETILAEAEAGELSEEAKDAASGLAIILNQSEASAESVHDKLASAMDDIPEGWMVRNTRVGPQNLKALAGAGVVGNEIPEVRFGSDLEVGPGWVRHGNRRKLNIQDERTMEAIASGPSTGTTFLARPWVNAARYVIVDDPHREETPIKGAGIWPAEWRAFVEEGVVVGVSYYYSWSGQAEPLDAVMSLKVRELAQKIVDKATELEMWPRYMDLEFARSGQTEAPKKNEAMQAMLKLFDREKVACTLDFIETDDGLKFLEGGPANTPVGGGHPCGFAGHGGAPGGGRKTNTHGVALKNMPHVILGDPRTWDAGDPTGCIFTWDEIHELASQYDPSQTNANTIKI